MNRIHYTKYANIFLYVTTRCQLRCKHCYMGARLNHVIDMQVEFAYSVLRRCKNLGAVNLTLIGGEPSLYPNINQLISYANDLGYGKITIDTNATSPEVLDINYLSNCIAQVSIDGAEASTHDYIRGPGTFEKTIANIKELKKKDVPIVLTTTINRKNISEIEDIIRLAEELEAKRLNIHVLSEEGTASEYPELAVHPQQWINACDLLQKIHSKVEIWYPPTWILKTNKASMQEHGYKGCLGLWEDRLSIFPDGKAYICSVMFDQDNWNLCFNEKDIVLNKKDNEYELFINAMAESPDEFVCPAIKKLQMCISTEKTDYLPVCRCWKIAKDGGGE